MEIKKTHKKKKCRNICMRTISYEDASNYFFVVAPFCTIILWIY
jgi:hypothetical protein